MGNFFINSFIILADRSAISSWGTIGLIIGLIICLPFAPANIAAKKGYSKGGFWLFGLFLFIPALIVALCIHEKKSEAADSLLKYKTLLDQGVISQSEFENKKRELLK